MAITNVLAFPYRVSGPIYSIACSESYIVAAGIGITVFESCDGQVVSRDPWIELPEMIACSDQELALLYEDRVDLRSVPGLRRVASIEGAYKRIGYVRGVMCPRLFVATDTAITVFSPDLRNQSSPTIRPGVRILAIADGDQESIVVGFDDRTVEVISLQSNVSRHTLRLDDLISPQGLAAARGTVYCLDISGHVIEWKTDGRTRRLGADAPAKSIAIETSSGSLYIASYDGEILAFDREGLKIGQVQLYINGMAQELCSSRRCIYVIGFGSGVAALSGGRLINSKIPFGRLVEYGEVTPSNRIAIYSDGHIVRWDGIEAKMARLLHDRINASVVTAECVLIATAKEVIRLSPGTLEVMGRFPMPIGHIRGICKLGEGVWAVYGMAAVNGSGLAIFRLDGKAHDARTIDESVLSACAFDGKGGFLYINYDHGAFTVDAAWNKLPQHLDAGNFLFASIRDQIVYIEVESGQSYCQWNPELGRLQRYSARTACLARVDMEGIREYSLVHGLAEEYWKAKFSQPGLGVSNADVITGNWGWMGYVGSMGSNSLIAGLR